MTPKEVNTVKPRHHLDHLDAARGIAALMVMVYHYINWTRRDYFSSKLGSIIFNGSDAVSFFFVLSGFVLSYKYIVLNEQLDIRKFYINRLFRLWPAFFVTIVINVLAVLYRTEINLHSLTDAFILNKIKFWEEAMLIWTQPNFYGPGWTLVIELAASFFLPFVIVLAKKDIRYLYWMLGSMLLFSNVMMNMYHFHFILGTIACSLFFYIIDPAFRNTKWYKYRYIIVLLSIIVFSIRHIDRFSPMGPTYTYIAQYLGINFYHYTGLASLVFMVVLLRSERLKKILTIKPLLFLGRISYGLYLMHWMLDCVIFMRWKEITPMFKSDNQAFVVVFLLYAVTAIIMAVILHYTIELPFIRLGKQITRRMKPSLVIE